MTLTNAWHQQTLIMTSLLCMQQLIEQYLHSAVSYHAKYVLLGVFLKAQSNVDELGVFVLVLGTY